MTKNISLVGKHFSSRPKKRSSLGQPQGETTRKSASASMLEGETTKKFSLPLKLFSSIGQLHRLKTHHQSAQAKPGGLAGRKISSMTLKP
ncbi:hypothetical protein [Pseudoxanthomonas sp. 3HH-4]|uniref:hypothetical protein n=1 Tax=Pseudoxanthomonas sp. 3HH-4 TaxID=1690214 RepID=UPI00114FA403|nr:hypothetical protein [Pseudoxanthomonas sp. 3HH-4]